MIVERGDHVRIVVDGLGVVLNRDSTKFVGTVREGADGSVELVYDGDLAGWALVAVNRDDVTVSSHLAGDLAHVSTFFVPVHPEHLEAIS